MTQPNDGLIEFWVEGEAMPVTLENLWLLAQSESSRYGQQPCEAFASVGLRLEKTTSPWQYYCTPKNVRTFASSGCDGVHFSFLVMDYFRSGALQTNRYAGDYGQDYGNMPVVMTVPMNFDNQNIVIAENLHEFLCLGCRAGYFELEHLASVGEEFSRLKASQVSDVSQKQAQCLSQLREVFALSPLKNLEARMRQLQARYLDCLQLGDVVTVSASRSMSEKPRLEKSMSERSVRM